MIVVREPVLKPVAIAGLRPTQITVGMREVAEKRRHWRRQQIKKQAEFLGRHMIPVIGGPKERYYIIDHHHLTVALYQEGVRSVLVTVVADLKALPLDDFWKVLDHHAWVHPYDTKGRRRRYDEIPKSVLALKDDPYRSLAGVLRRAGGFAKDTTPFSEFLWADFLRRRIALKAIGKDFAAALKRARLLAKGEEANYLPGWCGPVPEVK
jgi:hypothetical protein